MPKALPTQQVYPTPQPRLLSFSYLNPLLPLSPGSQCFLAHPLGHLLAHCLGGVGTAGRNSSQNHFSIGGQAGRSWPPSHCTSGCSWWDLSCPLWFPEWCPGADRTTMGTTVMKQVQLAKAIMLNRASLAKPQPEKSIIPFPSFWELNICLSWLEIQTPCLSAKRKSWQPSLGALSLLSCLFLDPTGTKEPRARADSFLSWVPKDCDKK